jgi:hypothetical protein
MGDSCLKSVHLEAPRRQQFRLAREGLLNARGSQTIAVQSLPEPEARPRALDATSATVGPAGGHFWLTDGQGTYPLKVGINAVGRSADCDVVVQDAFISRRHCAILVHAGTGCEIHDIASKNGTFVNGCKIAGPTVLHSGDEIRICDRQFVFMDRLAAAQPASPSVTHVDPLA